MNLEQVFRDKVKQSLAPSLVGELNEATPLESVLEEVRSIDNRYSSSREFKVKNIIPGHWKKTTPVIFSQISDPESPVSLYLKYHCNSEQEAGECISDMLANPSSPKAKEAVVIGASLKRILDDAGWENAIEEEEVAEEEE